MYTSASVSKASPGVSVHAADATATPPKPSGKVPESACLAQAMSSAWPAESKSTSESKSRVESKALPARRVEIPAGPATSAFKKPESPACSDEQWAASADLARFRVEELIEDFLGLEGHHLSSVELEHVEVALQHGEWGLALEDLEAAVTETPNLFSGASLDLLTAARNAIDKGR